MRDPIAPRSVQAYLLFGLLLLATHAAALPRTFVSGTAVDNPACSFVAPCRTFTAAIAATSPGGEILVLDSAGYGPVTIGQSVTIVAPPGVYAGISVAGGEGITINALPMDFVTLRGLTINSTGGTTGVHVISAAKVFVERTLITNFSGAGGIGILDDAVGSSRLILNETTIRTSTTGIRLVSANFKILEMDNVLVSDVITAIVTQGFVNTTGRGVTVWRTGGAAAAIQFLLPGTTIASAAFDQLSVSDATGGGILVQTGPSSGFALDVVNSSFMRGGGKAIFVDASAGGFNQVTATRSRFGYLTNRAIDVTGGFARVGINEVTIENTSAAEQIHFDVKGSSNLQISNTRIQDFGGTAVYARGVVGGTVAALLQGNTFSAGSKGVVADSYSTVRLSGNSIANLGSTALTIQGVGSSMTSLGNNFIDGDVGVDAVPAIVLGK